MLVIPQLQREQIYQPTSTQVLVSLDVWVSFVSLSLAVTYFILLNVLSVFWHIFYVNFTKLRLFNPKNIRGHHSHGRNVFGSAFSNDYYTHPHPQRLQQHSLVLMFLSVALHLPSQGSHDTRA